MDKRTGRRKLPLLTIAVAAAMAVALIAAASAAAAPQHWYVGGAMVQSPTEVSGSNSGDFNFGVSFGGVTIDARCSSAVVGGVIANPQAGATFTAGSLSLRECVYSSSPSGHPVNPACVVGTGGKAPVNGQLNFNPIYSSQAIEGGIRLAPEGGETFLNMKVSGANCPEGLKGEKVFKGSMRAVPTAGVPGSFEFSTSSGSNLVAGGFGGFITGRFTLQSKAGESATLGA